MTHHHPRPHSHQLLLPPGVRPLLHLLLPMQKKTKGHEDVLRVAVP
jgi:hypothetical protein